MNRETGDNSQLEIWGLGDKANEQDDGAKQAEALRTLGLLPLDGLNPANKAVLDASFARQRPLNILVVDDNEINRKVIRVILSKLGYGCREACDGREALKALESESADLIFMDLEMPELTGIEAAQRIRAVEQQAAKHDEAATEIIAVTANVSSNLRLSCRRAGMNGYLTKPVTTLIIKEQILKSWSRIKARRASKPTLGL